MTSELFTRLTISDTVVGHIKEYRQLLPQLDELKQEAHDVETLIAANPDPKAEMNKDLKAQLKKLRLQMSSITTIKTSLPTLMYQAARFDVTKSKKGYNGRWRKQAAVRLNGLYMVDIDHVENPRTAIADMLAKTEEPDLRTMCDELGIVLVHVTPSGHGLRLVAVADAKVGNIADNQAALSARLGVEPDTACKDASRCSFCPMFEDILYINTETLFNYENKDYDEMFGPLYRKGNSRPTVQSNKSSARPAAAGAEPDTEPADMGGDVACGNTNGVGGSKDHKSMEADNGADKGIDGDSRRDLNYHGKSYKDIIDQWFTCNGGEPKSGDRHQTLYRLACDLRYICDFDPSLLARLLKECKVGADVCSERGEAEIERIASDACTLQRYRTLPKRILAVLNAAGVQLADGGADQEVKAIDKIDYDAWWRRLSPLLEQSPVLQEAVVAMPDHLKLAGVLAAGAMLGTYLTRCWWEHFDGKDYRLSFLVYIIGPAASGKSFVTEMDRLIMAPMLAADNVGREWERQYKEDMKKRAASSKDAKAAAPEQQHPCIRYVPSSISNAMLYRRLTDAIDNESQTPDGQTPLHLHIYTMEPELATALRAQQGSWAGKNDLELKSFHNEYAGVDFANDQSVNGIIQVNWNQVVTGTPESLSRKIKPLTVLDGLVTRLVLFPMPGNDFQMIDRRTAMRDPDRETLLRSVGITLDQIKGRLDCKQLVDYCYNYERQLTDDARLEQDLTLDYFRKRIPVIMMRYALVRAVLRQTDELLKGQPLKLRDDDLEFARLIGDWCLMAQMHFFGTMVEEAQQRERTQFVPKRRSRKVRDAFAALPNEFKDEALVANGTCKSANAARVMLSRWAADGLVEKSGKCWKKLLDQIPN